MRGISAAAFASDMVRRPLTVMKCTAEVRLERVARDMRRRAVRDAAIARLERNLTFIIIHTFDSQVRFACQPSDSTAGSNRMAASSR